MFDLPMETSSERHAYTVFRRMLMRNGFIMMQESIYTKLAINAVVAKQVRRIVANSVPKNGLVQMLTITEKQFSDMELLLGKTQSTYLDNDDRLVIL